MDYLTLIMVLILLLFLFKRLILGLIIPTPPTGIIGGTATKVTGEPVSGATVTLYKKEDLINSVATTTTDATGKYVLPAEPKADYNETIVLSNPDGSRYEGTKDFTLSEATMTVDMTLVRFNRINQKEKKVLSLMWTVHHIANKLAEFTDKFKRIRSTFHGSSFHTGRKINAIKGHALFVI